MQMKQIEHVFFDLDHTLWDFDKNSNLTFQKVFEINKIQVNITDFNHLLDGAFELLDYLQGKYQLHIITNGFQEVQSKKMINSKIDHYFDKIITSESVGVKKPNPKVFKYALEYANADIEKSIMIGDNLEADVEGALNIGLKAIHCNFNNSSITNPKISTVTSLLELKQYL
ncbi:HAD-IA family hydrolase [Polaribacter batillariae]|uniref:HAD-IA family hydrolase n=1 Tax=Polaribacter batillariae TaxID=2808900 RepID=A0ABX7SRR8_9FLAO|nr:HAD-IA family hydrolase [Polaribacter batillariae]QTD36955.1 HAD-IA family hydrolase [Polaribacter batillariae]